MKKLFQLNLVLLFMGLLLLGCSGGGSSGGGDDNNNNTSASQPNGAWGMPALIETDDINAAYNPQIACNMAGNAIAVWYQADQTIRRVWVNYFDGTSWGTAELIAEYSYSQLYDPNARVAMNEDGDAIVVWNQEDGYRKNIYARYFDGASWSIAEKIEDDDINDAISPRIAFDHQGNAIAVWLQYDGTGQYIWNVLTNRFDGINWGVAEIIDNGVDTAYAPRIAISNEGKAIAIWSQMDGSQENIYANHFDGASWGTPKLVEEDGGAPSVAFRPDGSAIAVWKQLGSTGYNLLASRYDGNNWGIAELIENKESNVYWPNIAIDGEGNAIVVWCQSDSIWAIRFDGENWSTAELIEDNRNAAHEPKLAIDGNGHAISIWHQNDDGRYNIWANSFDGMNWGTAELIEDNDAKAYSQQIAFNGNGNAIAVWEQGSNGEYSIWVNRFDFNNR